MDAVATSIDARRWSWQPDGFLREAYKGSYFVLLIGPRVVPGLGVVLTIPSEGQKTRKA